MLVAAVSGIAFRDGALFAALAVSAFVAVVGLVLLAADRYA